MPKEFKCGIEIQDVPALIQMIQRLPDYDRMFHRIGLVLENGAFTLLAKADKEDPWKTFTVSNAKVNGKNARVFINREYLTKALQFGLSIIEFTDELNPVKMSCEGRQLIIAPVRADASTTPAAKGTDVNKPAANPPAAQPEERNTTMPAKNGNGSHQEPAAEKPTLETALTQIEKIKGSYREAIRGLNDLGDTLKAIGKERKSIEKEVQSVRSTLEKLQSVRL